MVLPAGSKGLFVLAATCAVLASAPLQAGNDRFYNSSRHLPPRHDGGAVIGGNGLPSVIPGLGTFAGSLSAVRVKGTGIYMAIENWPVDRSRTYQPPKAKIIEINAETSDAACAYEAGVCVIRPH